VNPSRQSADTRCLTPVDGLEIAQLNALPLRQAIVLFDDVLTTGKHFNCCERRLREVVPTNVPIMGVFIARRILPEATAEFEDIT